MFYRQRQEIFFEHSFLLREPGLLYGEDDAHAEREMIKAELTAELIEKYGYEAESIWIRQFIPTAFSSKEEYREVDVVVLNDQRQAYMAVAVATQTEYMSRFEDSIRALFQFFRSLREAENKLTYLLYYTRWHERQEHREAYALILYPKFRTFAVWDKAGRPTAGVIPKNQRRKPSS